MDEPSRFDVAALHAYSEARRQFLKSFGKVESCRDPFAEFSEHVVQTLLNATRAKSRVQKGFDLVRPNGRFVEVRSLSNSTAAWVNGHRVDLKATHDDYALVIFEEFRIRAVIVFPKETLADVNLLLKKRHGDLHKRLDFYRANLETILANKPEFERLGVLIFQP
jgi:hypothetical protein